MSGGLDLPRPAGLGVAVFREVGRFEFGRSWGVVSGPLMWPWLTLESLEISYCEVILWGRPFLQLKRYTVHVRHCPE